MTKKILFISFVILGLIQFSVAQTPAKKKLAGQLTRQTISVLPIQYFEDSFADMNAKQAANLEKTLSDTFLQKLEKSALTAEEKELIKERIAAFTQKVSLILKDLMTKDFNIGAEANKLLEKNYQKIFTLAELRRLDKFFKTSDGQFFVTKFNQLVTGKLNGTDNGITDLDEQELERTGNLLGERLLVKFTGLLIEKAMDDISKYIDNWSNKMTKNIEKEMLNGAIKKEMDKFLAENFTDSKF
jgi:hypothetical protein